MDHLCLVCQEYYVHGRYALPDGTGYCSAACEVEAHATDYVITNKNRMVNTRMSTLNRQMGILNRYRNMGIL